MWVPTVGSSLPLKAEEFRGSNSEITETPGVTTPQKLVEEVAAICVSQGTRWRHAGCKSKLVQDRDLVLPSEVCKAVKA